MTITESRLRELADAMPQFVWDARPDGYAEYFNRRCYEYCGLTPDETAGEGWLQVVHPDDRARAVDRWKWSLATGEPYEIEYRFRRASDGAYRWFLGRALPVKDATGTIVRWYGTCTDIDDFKRLQEERTNLLESERAARNEAERAGRMKDEFLATLSHELRTPLNAILGWTHLLKHGHLSTDDISRGIDTIERNARIQTQLIEDLLDMSRIISGKTHLKMQELPLGTVVEAAMETVAPAASAKGIRLQMVLDSDAPAVWGDPARMQQIVWNLLSNAVKFSEEEGSVQAWIRRAGRQVQIRVSDSGRGIEADFLPYVFDRFRQADSSTSRPTGGLGLGLAIVKHLVEMHGGTVSVASPGTDLGATFTVSLPIFDPQRAPPVNRFSDQRVDPDASAAAVNVDLTGLSVLVVDDEPDARELTRRVLEQVGARVFTAASAAEGYEMLAAERPGIIVSDLGMPGTDGYEFIRRVRETGPGEDAAVPALALTAFARAEDQRQALSAGYQAHLSKPVDPRMLAAVVAKLAGFEPGDY
jgi:hypothetical protein